MSSVSVSKKQRFPHRMYCSKCTARPCICEACKRPYADHTKAIICSSDTNWTLVDQALVASERKPRKDIGQPHKRRKVEGAWQCVKCLLRPSKCTCKELTSATFVRTGTEVPKEQGERVIEALVQASREAEVADELVEMSP